MNEEKSNKINLKQKSNSSEQQLTEEKGNNKNLVTEQKNNSEILKDKINYLEKELEK